MSNLTWFIGWSSDCRFKVAFDAWTKNSLWSIPFRRLKIQLLWIDYLSILWWNMQLVLSSNL